jgi:hypothetical protein
MAITPTIIDKQYKQIWGFDPRTIPTCNLWIDTSTESTTDLSIYGNKVVQSGNIIYNTSPNGLKYGNVESNSYFSAGSASANIDPSSVHITGIVNLINVPQTYITIDILPTGTRFASGEYVNVGGTNAYSQTAGMYPSYIMNIIPTQLYSQLLYINVPYISGGTKSILTTNGVNALTVGTPVYFTKSTKISHSVSLGKVINTQVDNIPLTTYYVKTTQTSPNHLPSYWGYFTGLYITISGYTDVDTNGVFQIASVSDTSITVANVSQNQVADSSTGTVSQVQVSGTYAKYILTVDPTDLGYIADGNMSINISGMSAINTITSSSTGTLYLITGTNEKGTSPYYVSVAKTLQVDMSNIPITKVAINTSTTPKYANYYTTKTSMCIVGQFLTVNGYNNGNDITNAKITYILSNTYIRVALTSQTNETNLAIGSVTANATISQFSPGTGIATDTGIQSNTVYYVYQRPDPLTNTLTGDQFTISFDNITKYDMLIQQFPTSTYVKSSAIIANSNIIAKTTRIISGNYIYVDNIDWLDRGDTIWLDTSSTDNAIVNNTSYYIQYVSKIPDPIYNDYAIQLSTTLPTPITITNDPVYVSNIYLYGVNGIFDSSIRKNNSAVATVGMIQLGKNRVKVNLTSNLDTSLSKMITIKDVVDASSSTLSNSTTNVEGGASGYNGTYQLLSTPGVSNTFNIQTTLNGGPSHTNSKAQIGLDIGINDFAIFAVVNIPTNYAKHGLLSKNASTLPYWSLYVDTTNKLVFNYTNSTGSSKATAISVVSGWHMISVVSSRTGNTVITIDGYGNTNTGTASGNATSLSSNSITYIGRDQTTYWNSGIGEILMYNTTINSTIQQTIEGYLAWKWGLQTNLPTLHNALQIPQISIYQTRPFARLLAPTDISNCKIWLDSNDSRSIYCNSMTMLLSTSNTGLATVSVVSTSGIIKGNTIVVLGTNTTLDGYFFTVIDVSFTGITFQTNTLNQPNVYGTIAYNNYNEKHLTTSQYVAAWVDKSNNGNTASQFNIGATSAGLPLYNYNLCQGVLFSATSTSLSDASTLVSNFSPGNQYETGFIVFKADKFSNRGSAISAYFSFLVSSTTYVWNSSGNYITTSSGLPKDTRSVFLFQHAATYSDETVFAIATVRKWGTQTPGYMYSPSVNSGDHNAGLLHAGNTYMLVYTTQWTTGDLLHRINGVGVPINEYYYKPTSFDSTGTTLSSVKTLIGPVFQGSILEYIAYTGTSTSTMLSNTDIQRVEGYLSKKWNITLTSGHPFYTIPPDKSVPY